jgi:hypothetical protein
MKAGIQRNNNFVDAIAYGAVVAVVKADRRRVTLSAAGDGQAAWAGGVVAGLGT